MFDKTVLAQEYADLLTEFVGRCGGEEGRLQAYQFGRRALAEGLGSLDLLSFHEHVLMSSLIGSPADERVAERTRLACDFLNQVLSPFEMALRGFEESNAALQQMNETLEQRVKERTAELERKASELDVANKELEAFSYSVSHDLRAPLREIDGFSKALLEDYAERLDEEGSRYLGFLRRESQRMAQLVDDLLGLSRVTRYEMSRTAVNLSELVESIAEDLRRTDPDRQVNFVIAAGLTAEGDPRLLRVALQNLLANAWKFTSKHPTATIAFGATEREGERAFFIRDDGAGFDMEYAGKLFGAFQRLHGENEFPGTGIGLATVQRIIRRHGGRIWAEGAEDHGATFYFTL